MARPNNSGWDFIKVGKIYQYREEWEIDSVLIAMVEILEDHSNDEFYEFRVKPLMGTEELRETGPGSFTIKHVKSVLEVYSGMPQFYENEEYTMLPIGTPWPVNFIDN